MVRSGTGTLNRRRWAFLVVVEHGLARSLPRWDFHPSRSVKSRLAHQDPHLSPVTVGGFSRTRSRNRRESHLPQGLFEHWGCASSIVKFTHSPFTLSPPHPLCRSPLKVRQPCGEPFGYTQDRHLESTDAAASAPQALQRTDKSCPLRLFKVKSSSRQNDAQD